MGERSSPTRSSAPHFWQRSLRQLRLRFANYVLTFLDLKKKKKEKKVEQGEVLALRVEVIGSMFYRFLLMELTPPQEVKRK